MVVLGLDCLPTNGSAFAPIDHEGKFVSSFVVRGLTRELVDGAVTADALESVVTVGDERSWMVTIGDARWSDGSPLTIDEALSGVRAVARHPEHRLAAHLDPSRPAEVIDANRAVVHLRRPAPYFPALLTQPQFAPRPGRRNRRTLADFVVDHSDDASLTLVSSRDDESDRPDVVSFRVVPRGGSVAAIEAGDVDITTTTGLSAEEVAHFARQGILRSGPGNLFGDLLMGPRLLASGQGLSLARHLRAVTDPHVVVQGLEPLVRAATSRCVQDVESSGRGPTSSGGRDPLSVIVPAYSPNIDVVRAAVAQWERHGWSVVIRELAMDSYIEALRAGEYDFVYVISPLEFPHPLARFTPWMAGGGMARWTGVSNPVLDRYIEDCAGRGFVPDVDGDLHALWLDASPVIPLVQTQFNYALSGQGIDCQLTPSGLAHVSEVA